jgi:hypothetical protein
MYIRLKQVPRFPVLRSDYDILIMKHFLVHPPSLSLPCALAVLVPGRPCDKGKSEDKGCLVDQEAHAFIKTFLFFFPGRI